MPVAYGDQSIGKTPSAACHDGRDDPWPPPGGRACLRKCAEAPVPAALM